MRPSDARQAAPDPSRGAFGRRADSTPSFFCRSSPTLTCWARENRAFGTSESRASSRNRAGLREVSKRRQRARYWFRSRDLQDTGESRSDGGVKPQTWKESSLRRGEFSDTESLRAFAAELGARVEPRLFLPPLENGLPTSIACFATARTTSTRALKLMSNASNSNIWLPCEPPPNKWVTNLSSSIRRVKFQVRSTILERRVIG